MPDGLSPTEGVGALLDYILIASLPGVLPWQMVLWVNDITPTVGTTFSDLQEATFGGYRRFTLDRELWTPAEVSAGCARSQWGLGPIEWVPYSGPLETVYGYALYDATMNVLRWVQRFDPADVRPIAIGRPLRVLPVLTLSSARCGSG